MLSFLDLLERSDPKRVMKFLEVVDGEELLLSDLGDGLGSGGVGARPPEGPRQPDKRRD